MNFLSLLFKRNLSEKESKEIVMKKYLIVGLGNIGPTYKNTRHNIGFKILDEVAAENNVAFITEKLGDIASFNFKGKKCILLKPNTFMNLSGKAVKYWMQQENISLENLLVVTDDVNIDFGTIRVKAKGSAGGHNGLKDIQEKLNTDNYARFRFGVGANFSKGKQVDFVLGEWSKEETSHLIERLPMSAKVVLSFATDGLENTMNVFNGK
jgi:PTH1 family peptidyl-tRNA hydrolase